MIDTCCTFLVCFDVGIRIPLVKAPNSQQELLESRAKNAEVKQKAIMEVGGGNSQMLHADWNMYPPGNEHISHQNGKRNIID